MNTHTSSSSSALQRLGTSPELRMLLMSSRKDSSTICVSLNRNTVGLFSTPVSRQSFLISVWGEEIRQIFHQDHIKLCCEGYNVHNIIDPQVLSTGARGIILQHLIYHNMPRDKISTPLVCIKRALYPRYEIERITQPNALHQLVLKYN